MAAVAASGKAAEVDALSAIAEHLGPSLEELPGNEAGNPLFARLVAAWADQPAPAAARGVAGDVALIHIASMSNLFAALGWALVDLFAHPLEASRVAAGDRATAEVCALESIRVAQRSIMARYAMAPFNFDVGDAVFEVSPGTTVATLLPLTNMSSAPGLATVGPHPLEGTPARRFLDPGRGRVGDCIRPRTPYLSGSALLPGCHDHDADPASLQLPSGPRGGRIGRCRFEPRSAGWPVPAARVH